MNSLVFAALVSSAAGTTPVAVMPIDSPSVPSAATLADAVAPVASGARTHGHRMGGGQGMTGMHRGHGRWGIHRGRWVGGWRAPGGWGAYRAPFRGYVMPRYWVNPGFAVVNYPVYGLRQPDAGYNWSRYYDDAVLSDSSGRVYDSVPGVAWDREDIAEHNDNRSVAPEYGPEAGYDDSSYGWDDRVYADGEQIDGARSEAGTYQGSWTGGYVDPENRVYKGKWDGTYTGEDGRVYQGSYKGTAIGEPRYGGPARAGAGYDGDDYGASYDDGYDAPRHSPVRERSYSRSRDGYEQCRNDSGIGGAVIGGVVGGFAGNRIAGRGDRTAGTLIGGGLGALTGLALEKAIRKCDRYRPAEYRRDYDDRGGYAGGYRHHRGAPSSYGWQGGYAYNGAYGGYPGYYPAYYYPQPHATTVVIQPGSSTTTTTTTYEEVYTAAPKARRPLKRLRKPCYCD